MAVKLVAFWKTKKKDRGPFRADRILDTPEAKIDQVYTREEEKPVALLVHTTEEEAKRIGAGGYFGPTKFAAKGEYERDKSWVTKPIYFSKNIPGVELDSTVRGQIENAVRESGTYLSPGIQYEKIESPETIPVSGTATVSTDPSGTLTITKAPTMEEPATFAFSVKEEIVQTANALEKDITCKDMLPTEAWESRSPLSRTTLIQHRTDYTEVSEFYERIRVRNRDIETGDTGLIRRHNEESLRLAKIALKNIDWNKYSA